MALPADFSKIFGSTATGGLTPIGDVNYAKGWEFVGSNPPTKNDFTYLQYLSDQKAKWLYDNNVGRLIGVKTFNSSGTYTPTDGTKSIIVEVQGGGGGGGNAKATSSTTYTLTSSGGAGGYAKSRLTNLAASYSVTIGAGGAGGASGGQSVFGSITCGGGGAGSQIGGHYTASSSVVTLGASGGGASGGNIVNVPGSSADPSLLIAGGAVSAVGGNSVIGTGGKGAGSSSADGLPGTLGGGGGGANAAGNTTLIAGGKGGDGIVIIWEFA